MIGQAEIGRIHDIEISPVYGAEMNPDHVFHALVATLYQLQFVIARRLLDDPGDISFHAEIPNGALLTQWLSHDDDDEIFNALDRLGFLKREAGSGSYDFNVHALELRHSTLREQLIREPLSGSIDEQSLIGCFIQFAVRMDRHSVIGNVRLPGLPIHKDWFPVPSYYEEAMRDMAAAEYCEFEAGKAIWLPAVSGIMEARGFWVSGGTADEIREAGLVEVWRTMPDEIRKLTLLEQDYPDPKVLAFLMGHFWREDTGWVFKSSDLHADIFETLQGGHTPSAIKISEMVKGGL